MIGGILIVTFGIICGLGAVCILMIPIGAFLFNFVQDRQGVIWEMHISFGVVAIIAAAVWVSFFATIGKLVIGILPSIGIT